MTNPYDREPVQLRKAARMRSELESLGVETRILPNDGTVVAICGGRAVSDIQADFVLYFDKERITARLLEKLGIRVFNSAYATEVCDDKLLTHTLLADNGILMPDTLVGPMCYVPKAPLPDGYVNNAVAKLGLPIVVKQCHGSFGKQVFLCETLVQLEETLNRVKTTPFLLQKCERESMGKDMRVIVIGGKAVCAMERVNTHDFRSNAALGGECRAVQAPKDISEMCQKAAKIIGLDFCGADVLLTDPPKLCEINSNAMFEAMESATGFNVARAYALHIVQSVKKTTKEIDL